MMTIVAYSAHDGEVAVYMVVTHNGAIFLCFTKNVFHDLL